MSYGTGEHRPNWARYAAYYMAKYPHRGWEDVAVYLKTEAKIDLDARLVRRFYFTGEWRNEQAAIDRPAPHVRDVRNSVLQTQKRVAPDLGKAPILLA